jgi:hypothetical protein
MIEADLGMIAPKNKLLLIRICLTWSLKLAVVLQISSLCSWFLAHKGEPPLSPKGCQMYLSSFVSSHGTCLDEILHPCTNGRILPIYFSLH